MNRIPNALNTTQQRFSKNNYVAYTTPQSASNMNSQSQYGVTSANSASYTPSTVNPSSPNPSCSCNDDYSTYIYGALLVGGGLAIYKYY